MLLAMLDAWLQNLGTTWKTASSTASSAPAYSPAIFITSPSNGTTVSGVATIQGYTKVKLQFGASVEVDASFSFGLNTPIRNDGLSSFSVTNGFNTATIQLVIHNGTASSTPYAKFWGVNGHLAYPQFSPSHNPVSPGATLSRLQELGVKMFRSDVGGEGAASVLAERIIGFASAGIEVMPVFQCFSNGCFDPAVTAKQSEAVAYSLGYSMGFACANKLRGLVTKIECGNELDAYNVDTSLSFKIAGNGCFDSDWRQSYWPAYRGVHRGMIDGVRAASAGIECGVNIGVPMAYPCLQMLREGREPNGSSGKAVVDWDFTTYHWYHSYGDIRAGAGTADVISIVHALGKPIHLTEIGWSGGGDQDTSTSSSASWYMRFTLSAYYAMRVQFDIRSVHWYVLYDPDAGYGLISMDGATIRPSFNTYKDFIATHQSLSA